MLFRSGAVQLLSLPIEFTDAPPETTVETAAVSAAPLLPPAFPPVAAPPERVPGLSDSVTSQTDAPFDTQKAAELPTSTIVTPDSAKQPTPVAAGRRELGDRPLPPGLVDFAARAEPARTLPAPLRTDGIAPTVVPAPVAQEVVSPTVVPPVANGSKIGRAHV